MAISSKCRDTIVEARRLSALCRFDEALQALRETSERDPSGLEDRIQLHRAAARTFLSRGYPLKAKESIADAIELASDRPQHELLSLRLYEVFVKVVGCGERNQDDFYLEQAEDVLRTFVTLEDIDEDAVSIFLDLCLPPY